MWFPLKSGLCLWSGLVMDSVRVEILFSMCDSLYQYSGRV